MIRPFRRSLPTALLLAALAGPLLLTLPAAAQADEPGDFSQHKALHVRAEQQEIAVLAESLSCIALATDEAGLRACLAKKHQQLEALKAQHH